MVGAKLTELGEWVTPGQPVLNLVATGQLRLDFPVADDYLGAVGPDTPVTDGNPAGVFGWRPPAALVTALSDLLDGGEAAL